MAPRNDNRTAIARNTPSLYIPAMRAEIQNLVDEIKQSIGLLRRRL